MGSPTLSRTIRLFHLYRLDPMIRSPNSNSFHALALCRDLYRILSLMIRSSSILLLPKPDPPSPTLEIIPILPVVLFVMPVDRNERISPLHLSECELLLIPLPIELRVPILVSPIRRERVLMPITKLPFDLLGPPVRMRLPQVDMGGCSSPHLLIRLRRWVWLLLMLYPRRLDLV